MEENDRLNLNGHTTQVKEFPVFYSYFQAHRDFQVSACFQILSDGSESCSNVVT